MIIIFVEFINQSIFQFTMPALNATMKTLKSIQSLPQFQYWDRQVQANNANPDHIPQNVASDQDLHCLSIFQQFLDRLTLVLLNPDMSFLCKQCRSRSVGFWTALFAIKYVNLYQQSESNNLIGWKLEMGVASEFMDLFKILEQVWYGIEVSQYLGSWLQIRCFYQLKSIDFFLIYQKIPPKNVCCEYS